MPGRAVIIGLDGAAWHLLNPILEQGVMPRLAGLRDRGASGTLSSTVPTYTPPAWTSAITGVNPGRHGIYGFHAGTPQSERLDLMHSGKIKSPTLWHMANEQNARVGFYNVPLTYPPQKVDGWMVSGMMTPSYGHRLQGFTYPRELEASILSWVPEYLVDLPLDWEQDWRDASLCDRAIDGLGQRRSVLEGLLETDPPDVLFTVLETPDRLQHVYYRYIDPNDEMYDSDAGRSLRPAVVRVFEQMDRIVGLLDDFAGPQGSVIVCSDHGFTSWEASVHTNVLLESWGYLRLKPVARLMKTGLARRLVPLAKRFLPAKMARQAKKRTFDAIDWSRTRAFASYVPQQGIHVNLHGRERLGVVMPEELETVKEELAARFEQLKFPDGRLVATRIWRAEEVFGGGSLDGAPDLLPVLRDHCFELDDELFHKDPFTDYRGLPRGAHHPDGIVVLSGPGVRRTADLASSVIDITPTALYMAGLKVPEGLDGSVMMDAFDPVFLREHPTMTTVAATLGDSSQDASPYSEEEEALIEESLRGLGYL